MEGNGEGPARAANPWRTGVLIAAGLVAVLGIAGGVVAGVRQVSAQRAEAAAKAAREAEDARKAEAARAAAERRAQAEEARARAIEDCNRYAAQAQRDNRRIVREGAVGGAIGAGVGAAGGAIVGGKRSVGKGAGLGALLGATAGALHGLNEENRRSQQAQAAYRECMAQAGY